VDDRELFEREQAGLTAFYRLLAGGARGSRLIERADLVATVVPTAPERSFCNGVVPQSSQALSHALAALADAYEEAGVRAWTVWIPASDTRSALLLEQSGHRLDATPGAMALELEHFKGAMDEVELDSAPRFEDVAAINDLAYGYDGDFTRAIADLPSMQPICTSPALTVSRRVDDCARPPGRLPHRHGGDAPGSSG
jgi:hypothetical protein